MFRFKKKKKKRKCFFHPKAFRELFSEHWQAYPPAASQHSLGQSCLKLTVKLLNLIQNTCLVTYNMTGSQIKAGVVLHSTETLISFHMFLTFLHIEHERL